MYKEIMHAINKYLKLKKKLVGPPPNLNYVLAIFIRKSGHDDMSKQCNHQSMSTHSFTQAWAHRHTVH